MHHDLSKRLSDLNIEAPIEWNTEKPTRQGSQWFLGKKFKVGDTEVELAWFGDFKKGIREEWKGDVGDLKPADKAKITKQINAALELERLEREKVWVEQGDKLEKEFQEFSPLGRTPYMDRKQVKELYGARIKANPNGSPILVVPMRDTKGRFWNYQRIYSEKLSAGDKFFAEGAKIDGNFCTLGEKNLSQYTSVYICEGFATACSVQEAMPDSLVVAAFNANNLTHVAVAFKELNYTNITICADNDAYTVINGKPYNIGIEKGRAAAGNSGGSIVYPTFKHPQKGLTDFNDLLCAQGALDVKDQIENPSKYVMGIQPMTLPTTKAGKPILPTEEELSRFMLKHFEGKIVAQDKELFMYYGTHWGELSDGDKNFLKQKIAIALNHQCGIRDIENYFKYFVVHLPQVPKGIDMFAPNPFVANFANGTLHLIQDKLSYKTSFMEHSPTDYLMSVLPFDYPKERSPSPLFDKWLDSLYGNDPEKESKQRLIKQLMGACLMSAFPVIVFFQGRPGSGKSTLIKLMVKLLDQSNVCSVQPCDMYGFNMETMVSKLINYDTDIDTKKPIKDTIVKKIVDRNKMRIDRKNKTNVYGFLPAVHLFASNKLPITLDGSSNAYGRRMIIVRTDAWQIPEVDQIMNFEDHLLNNEREGIISRALEGLEDLLSVNGQYHRFQESRELVEEVESKSDSVSQFIDEINNGEVFNETNMKMRVDPEAKIDRKNLWEVFSKWQYDSVSQGCDIGKFQFFEELRGKGFKVVTTKGVRQFKGLGFIASGENIL